MRQRPSVTPAQPAAPSRIGVLQHRDHCQHWASAAQNRSIDCGVKRAVDLRRIGRQDRGIRRRERVNGAASGAEAGRLAARYQAARQQQGKRSPLHRGLRGGSPLHLLRDDCRRGGPGAAMGEAIAATRLSPGRYPGVVRLLNRAKRANTRSRSASGRAFVADREPDQIRIGGQRDTDSCAGRRGAARCRAGSRPVARSARDWPRSRDRALCSVSCRPRIRRPVGIGEIGHQPAQVERRHRARPYRLPRPPKCSGSRRTGRACPRSAPGRLLHRLTERRHVAIAGERKIEPLTQPCEAACANHARCRRTPEDCQAARRSGRASG